MKKNIIIGALIVLLVAAIGAIVWLSASLAAQKQAQVAMEQAQAAEKEAALESKLKISWPTANTKLCYEQQYSVSWQAPLGMDIVSIGLVTPSGTTKIGDYPAMSGTGDDVGYGSFQWDLTDASGSIVPASQVYKMSIAGAFHGHDISTTTAGVFSIGNCN